MAKLHTIALPGICTIILLLGTYASAQTQFPDAPDPKFLSTSNMIELSAVGASLAADGLSTQALFGWSRLVKDEANPLVPHPRAGTAAYFAAAFVADVGATYLLRNHPWYHRAFNLALTAVEVSLAARNYHLVADEQQQENFCLSHGTPLNSFQRCPR